MANILVICTANICRSPVAEALLRDRLHKRGLDDWTVSSAGTWAQFSRGAADNSILVMDQYGLDIYDHTARMVKIDHLQDADLILCMETGHAEALRTEFSRYAHKVFLLIDADSADQLEAALALPVMVTNDVRAATYGEWLYGAGQGITDLVCLFIGTGVGGGVVSGGKLLEGCNNTAGELGKTTINADGRQCHCRNRGFLEAYAGGWAIGERAQEAVRSDPKAGQSLITLFKFIYCM